MDNPSSLIIGLVIILVVFVIIFLLIREINCWYWKINERIELQKEIIQLLKKLMPHEQPKENNSANESIINPINQTLNSIDPTKNIFDSLSTQEKKIVDDLRMKGLGFGDKIIIHKTLRSILKVSKKEWKSYENYQNDWVIIYQ